MAAFDPDAFLADDDPFDPDAFLADEPDTTSMGGNTIDGGWRMDAESSEQGPPISKDEIEQVKQPLPLRVRHALAKHKAKQQLSPAEIDAIKQWTSRGTPRLGDPVQKLASKVGINIGDDTASHLATAGAHGANAFLGELGDEAIGALGGDKQLARDFLAESGRQNPGTAMASQLAGGGASGAMLPAGKLANVAQGAVTGFGASEEEGIGAIPEAIAGGVAGHYVGAALGKAARGSGAALGKSSQPLKVAGRLAGGAAQLTGRGVSALDEWFGGTGLGKVGGDAKVNTRPEFGDTVGEGALKRQVADAEASRVAAKEVPKAGEAPMQTATEAAPGPRRDVPAQNVDGMSTADAYGTLMREDPRVKAGIGYDSKIAPEQADEILGHYDRSMPTLNRIAAESNPEAAAIQKGRMPSNAEADEIMMALDRMRQEPKPKPAPATDNVEWYESMYGEQPAERYAGGPRPVYGPAGRAHGLQSFETPEAAAKAGERAFEKDLGMDRRWPDTKPGAGVDPDATARLGAKPRPMATDASPEMGPNDLRIGGKVVKNGRDPRTPLPPELAAPKARAPGQQPIRPVSQQGETQTGFMSDGETSAFPSFFDQDATQTAAQVAAQASKQQATAMKVEPWAAADGAKQRLQNIANGKRLRGRAGKMLPIVGQMAGAGVDMATELGKHMSNLSSGKATPGAFAAALGANPQMAQELAQMGGKWGAAGKEILRAMQTGGAAAAKARAYVISQQPWFAAQPAPGTASPDQQGPAAIAR